MYKVRIRIDQSFYSQQKENSDVSIVPPELKCEVSVTTFEDDPSAFQDSYNISLKEPNISSLIKNFFGDEGDVGGTPSDRQSSERSNYDDHSVCEYCGQIFETPDDYDRHMLRYKNENGKGFKCNICECILTTKKKMSGHMHAHADDKRFACNLCDYKSEFKSYLVKHLRSHFETKSYECEFCSFKCTQKWYLTDHMRRHSTEKPYECDVCSFRSAHKNNIAKHRRTHSGEKPFSCTLCKFQSAQKSNLITHMKIHTGDRPYSCDLCSYTSVQKNNLLIHKKVHSIEHPFLYSHSNTKPFSCKECDYRSTQKRTMIKHVKTHHRWKKKPRRAKDDVSSCDEDFKSKEEEVSSS